MGGIYMKIVRTIVNKKLELIGLVLKGTSQELGLRSDKKWCIIPYNLEQAKRKIKKYGCADFEIDTQNNIVSKGYKKLYDIPMVDENGNDIMYTLNLKKIIKKSNNSIYGVLVYVPEIDYSFKISLIDLKYLAFYCKPQNFSISIKENNISIKGKNGVSINEIPVEYKDKFEKGSSKNKETKKKKVINLIYDLHPNCLWIYPNKDKGYKMNYSLIDIILDSALYEEFTKHFYIDGEIFTIDELSVDGVSKIPENDITVELYDEESVEKSGYFIDMTNIRNTLGYLSAFSLKTKSEVNMTIIDNCLNSVISDDYWDEITQDLPINVKNYLKEHFLALMYIHLKRINKLCKDYGFSIKIKSQDIEFIKKLKEAYTNSCVKLNSLDSENLDGISFTM